MTNVIPEDIRRDMQSNARARLIVAASMVAIIVAALSFLALLPSYLVLKVNASGAHPSVAVIAPVDIAHDKVLIAHTTTLLNTLSPLVGTTSMPARTIQSVVALRPVGVHIDQITYIAGSPSSLMLVGSAETNGKISLYRDALVATALFTSVSVPVGALVGTDGGRFSITLLGAF